MKNDHQSSVFFVGRISPFLLFEMEFHSLFYIVERHKDDRFYKEVNPAAQAAFISLHSYFEAFCKHQFAAIVNIFPSLVHSFASKRGEPKLEFSTIMSFSGSIENSIGFILAESYDFGTAKSVNGLFRDLLKISPFSRDEERKFNSISSNRNLLVHHGGYYTFEYSRNNATTSATKGLSAFYDAVKIDTSEYSMLSDFLLEMAVKITSQSVKAVMALPEYIALDDSHEKKLAVQEMLRGLHDTLDVQF